jgi:hypothetical protein
VIGSVIHTKHDHGADIGPERLRARAALRIGGEPIHVAMAALRDETLKPLFRFRNGIRRSDAEAVEAMVARGIAQRALDRDGIGQKSRLA